MHTTALMNADLFFKSYLTPQKPHPFVVEIGSLDVNGSLRQVCPNLAEYVGVDFAPGKGVDVVLEDPYCLTFADESVDVCLSSSVFEHSEMFWLLFNEILRILRPDGLFYLNVPSNGKFHRYPVDCWRFYPDSGNALVRWAKRSGFNPAILESYTSRQQVECWNDFVAIFVKDETFASTYPRRITETYPDFTNGLRYGSATFINPREHTEDMVKTDVIAAVATGRIPVK